MSENDKKDEQIPYSVLNQPEQKIKPIKEKSRKRRRESFAWFLTFVGLIGFDIGFIKNINNLTYNDEIRTAYVRTIDSLKGFLPGPTTTVDGIRFYEPVATSQPAQIEIITTAKYTDGKSVHYDYFYNLAYKYYKSLKEAEESGDFKNYVKALNTCFQQMELISEDFSNSSTNFRFNEEQAKQFNEFFNLKEYNLNQVGFLPQYVNYKLERTDVVDPFTGEGKGVNRSTYTIKGLSFVEVGKKSGDNILPEDLSYAVLNGELNKKNIKVYETEYKLTYETTGDMVFAPDDFISVLKSYFAGEEQLAQNLNVVSTYVNEIDLTSFKMQENNFKFEKTK